MTPKKQNISEIRQVLEDLRRDYWQSLDTVEVEEKATREFLVFRMGGQRFAIAANTVREVVRLPARLVPVPRVAGHIRGLFNLRGQVFAVSDLGLFLGLAASTMGPNSRLLVVKATGLHTTLLAESVEGLRHFDLDALEPVMAAEDFSREETLGQLIEPEGMIIFLDLGQVFSRADFVIDEKVE
jgi:purine-binding chemotaxis protein CheW